MDRLQAFSSFLDNYWARSQVFRTVQFSSAMMSGLLERPHPIWAEKLMKLSSALSNMRIMLRLLDDLPIFAHVVIAWNQSQASTVMEKLAKLLNGLCTQFYYPVEHIAWAADQKLLSVNSTPLWTVAIILWALPLLIALIQKLKQMVKLCAQSSRKSSKVTTANGKLQRQHRVLVMGIAQILCDLTLAVFWLPPGILWAGKLPATWWGLLGTISSLIGLYKTTICQ